MSILSDDNKLNKGGSND